MPIGRRAALSTLFGLAWQTCALAQTPAPGTGAGPPQAGPVPTAGDWPSVIQVGGNTISVYLPQLDSWDGQRLEAHAAVSIQTSGSAQPTFGVAQLLADTQVDKGARQVTLDGLRIVRVHFPPAQNQEAAFKKLLEQDIPPRIRTIELDRLEAALAMREAQTKAESKPLRNDPPRIVFSTTPAILVLIDGSPAYQPVSGTAYARVVNTRPLILKDAAGAHYLRLFDGWMTAPAIVGPWSVVKAVPKDLDPVMQTVSKSGSVDLLAFVDPKDPKSRPS